MDKAFLLLVRDFSPYSDEVIQLLVTPFSPLKSKGKLITFESSNPSKTNYSMDNFTLGKYAIKAAIEVGRKIKTLNTTEVDSGITEAYQRALSDWSQHAPSSSDELRLNAALDGYLKNATSYEALDKDTKDFIDCFKKRLSEQPTALNHLMMHRADEQAQNEVLNQQEHHKTQELLRGLMSQMEGLKITPQKLRALLKELPLEQGRERTESALEDMLTNGRIHSEGAKCLIAEFVQFLFERTDKITEEAARLRKSGDSYLAETLEEIKKVLTGESEQSLTAVYKKYQEQAQQNEIRVLQELIEAAQIHFSFGEARTFYEQLIKLAPTVEHQFDYADLLQRLNDFKKARRIYEKLLQELRQLATQKPEAYIFCNIVAILNNFGMLLCNTNDLKTAQDCFREALQISQKWITQSPEIFQSAAAAALNNWGNLRFKLGELKQAQEHYEKELQIYRNLAKINPQAYLSDVAMALNNLAALYLEEGEDAEKVYQEAFDIYRRLTNTNTNTHEINYASLLIMGVSLLDKPTEHLEEAKAILSKHEELPKAQELLSFIENLPKK